ncbi:HAD family hydrolase [Actinacidiphila bryophytorum]|uniref:Hydrolase of the HAD superfamily n=1 Tax=Actinacidiphila bryophytorum TaxID=1436133 RepID=A0A9W4E398_9ACTN|nr:HAD family hydrolase [Actinacidiphila bryophytorum]MBM9435509.1 HAD family hydrolase [Actinacidiphila bryophytorum]MBN6544261.1 HAD family hydrolase [Actinacidiphila bryophytorum]CAG7608979.1 Putative hydrolase of the HAD superfamily [Actinacidiphila bryophytorum]
MAIRAVLWDIDDTIFDYASAERTGMRHHLDHEGLPDRCDSVGQALDLWRDLTVEHWRRFADGECDFEGQRRDRVRDFLGLPLTDQEAEAWFGRHMVHYEAAWALFPDTLPALDGLADGYRHAVLSNSAFAHQDRKLRTLGVRERFEVLLCAAELGVSKPEAEAFHAACRALDLEPREVAYVGNEPDIDARGASEAGLLGIWLDRHGVGGRPELARITGLHELPGLLRSDTRFGAVSLIG